MRRRKDEVPMLAPGGQRVETRAGTSHDHVAGVHALGKTLDGKRRRELRRYVLRRVHGEVGAAVEQRLFDLLDEQTLAADLAQGAILDSVPQWSRPAALRSSGSGVLAAGRRRTRGTERAPRRSYEWRR